MLLLLAVCVSGQDMENDFIPVDSIFDSVKARMEAMTQKMDDMMNAHDAAIPLKRGEVFQTALPGMEFQIDIEVGSEPEEGTEALERGSAHPHSIYELMKDRIHNMRERFGSMFHHRGKGKGKRFHQKMMVGQPEWVQNMPEEAQRHHLKKVQKMMIRKATLEQCPEADTLCPRIGCPKKIAKCLSQRSDKLSSKCLSFLEKFKIMRDAKKAAKKVYRESKKVCEDVEDAEKEHECKKVARKVKWETVSAARDALQTSLESEGSTIKVQTISNDFGESGFIKAEKMAKEKLGELAKLFQAKDVSDKVEDDKSNLDEGTPAWITGHVEAPAGEKDMGGWTMAVYSSEQQTRLGVDEEGKKIVDNKEMSEIPSLDPIHPNAVKKQHHHDRMFHKHGHFIGMGLGLVLLGVVFGLLIHRRRQVHALALTSVYDEVTCTEMAVVTVGSKDQV